MLSATLMTKFLPEEGGFTWMKAKTLPVPPLYYITIINEMPPALEVRSRKKATEISFRKLEQVIKS